MSLPFSPHLTTNSVSLPRIPTATLFLAVLDNEVSLILQDLELLMVAESYLRIRYQQKFTNLRQVLDLHLIEIKSSRLSAFVAFPFRSNDVPTTIGQAEVDAAAILLSSVGLRMHNVMVSTHVWMALVFFDECCSFQQTRTDQEREVLSTSTFLRLDVG